MCLEIPTFLKRTLSSSIRKLTQNLFKRVVSLQKIVKNNKNLEFGFWKLIISAFSYIFAVHLLNYYCG